MMVTLQSAPIPKLHPGFRKILTSPRAKLPSVVLKGSLWTWRRLRFQALPLWSKCFAVNSSKANIPVFTPSAKKPRFSAVCALSRADHISVTPPHLCFFPLFFFTMTLVFLWRIFNCRRVQQTLPSQSPVRKCQPQLGVQLSVSRAVKLAGLSTTGMLTWQIWES